MSVWASNPVTNSALRGSEGALISVSVTVDAHYLESLLDALAQLDFPINPQIYHDGAVRYYYDGDRVETEPATIVEFPAYAGRLPQIRKALEAYCFGTDCLHVTEMLDDIHSDFRMEPAAPGAPYQFRALIKHAHMAAAAH